MENTDILSTRNYVHIIGKPSDFDLRQSERIGKNGFIYAIDEDPIVMRRVPGGYIIWSCWGDEAEITEVQNSINN